MSIYHRVGCWPSESVLHICGTHPRAFPEINDEFLAEAKENLDAEIGEFVNPPAEEGEPFKKGERIAFKEFDRFPLTDKISAKVIAKKIVKLGKRVQRSILIDSNENDPDEHEILSHIITASMAAQSDF